MPPERRAPEGHRAAGGANAVYFEFVPQGAYVKVTAVDGETGTEASIVGAASAPQAVLERTAMAKLKFVLAKARKDQSK